MYIKAQAKRAFRDVHHWKYDPFSYTYYHERTGTIFHEDMLTKWKWDVRVIPHGRFLTGVISPTLHWQYGKSVTFGFWLWLTVFKNLDKIKRSAKWVGC